MYLPPSYDDAAHRATRYPVLYLLHGAPGGSRDWTDLVDVQGVADRLMAAGELPPLLRVMPDGNYGELGDQRRAALCRPAVAPRRSLGRCQRKH